MADRQNDVAETNQITDPNEAFGIVKSFQQERVAETEAHRAEAKLLKVNSDTDLYERLGKSHSLVQRLSSSVSDDALVELLAWHGLEPARPGHNSYRPITDMLWGEWKQVPADKKDDLKWKEGKVIRDIAGVSSYFTLNRTTEKYAKVMRFAADRNLTPEKLVETLADKTFSKVVDADTARNVKTDEELLTHSKYRAAVLGQQPLTKVPASKCGIPSDYGNKYASVWGRYTDDGGFEVMGMLPQSDTAIDRHIDKLAKKDGERLYIKMLESRLASQTVE